MFLNRFKKLFFDYGVTLIVALTIAFLIRQYVFESFRIPTQVMKPSLIAGDFIFASKVTKTTVLQYGDIVIYSPPSDLNKTYIKRIVGIQNDQIQIKNGKIYLHGSPLEFIAEPKKDPDQTCGKEVHPAVVYSICKSKPFISDPYKKKIPENSYFLIGDNRSHSASTRDWDIIPHSAIKSKVNLIWFSINPDLDGKFSIMEQIRWNRLFLKP